jgi:hypothetical protein
MRLNFQIIGTVNARQYYIHHNYMYLVSEESISSTVSQAMRASGEVAPNFLVAAMAASMAAVASGRAFKLVAERKPRVVGANPWTAVLAKSARDRESFMMK